MKEVQKGPFSHQITKTGNSLTEGEKYELVDQLIKSANLFAWAPSNMFGINTKVVTHRLSIHPSYKPVEHRKQKVVKEKRDTTDEEAGKPFDIEFIIKKPTWLANVVLV